MSSARHPCYGAFVSGACLYPLLLGSAAAIGAAFGSLMNVCLVRIPLGISLWWPPSRCDVCHTPVAWYENVPVLSWLILGGKCRTCGTSIPAFHPVVELLGAVLAWLVFRRFVPSVDQVDAPHLFAATLYFGFAWSLTLSALMDVRARIFPDGATLYAIPAGLVGATMLDAFGYHGWMDIGWRASFLGAFVGGGFFGALSVVAYLVLGREGLGWGDVRMLAMIGAFLGPIPGLFIVLMFGSLVGGAVAIVAALIQRRSSYVPFGPSLAAGAILYLLWGDVIVHRWMPGAAMYL